MDRELARMPWKRRILTQAAALVHLVGAAALALAAGGLVMSSPAFADPLQDALRERIEDLRSGRELRPAGAELAARRLIPPFYESRGFQPAWTDPERRRELLVLVAGSYDHGLDPHDYQLDALRRAAAREADDPGSIADRDLLFTDSLIRLAYHLRFGKVNPYEVHSDWNFSRSLGAIEPVQALEALIAADSLTKAVERIAPQLDAYRRLRAALRQYRAMEAAGAWPEVPSGPTLRVGDRDPRVVALRARLWASNDLAAPPAPDPALFDGTLDAAVKTFQRRHGLESDGAVGARTQAALAVAVARRIEQIRVNLERLRWVAQDIGGDYLLVDIAGFTARLYLDHQPAWSSRVVVGRPYRKTPIFRSTMQYLVLNPSWVVPPTILQQDVIPKAARDPAHLAGNRMRILDEAGRELSPSAIDWTRYGNRGERFPYRVVQAPGPANSLGQIKFMLPNPFMVYLHDTPSKGLFERTTRAFSSGCIRVERPLDLAARLLDDPVRWNTESLRQAIDSGETLTLQVRRRVPVMLLYHTAAVEDDGTVSFRPDLYDYDDEVLSALAGPFRFSTVGGPQVSPAL